LTVLLETITSCVSPFIQLAAIQAMNSSQSYIDEMILTYRRRRDLIVAGLNDIDGIQCLKPGGAFYVFPNIKGTGLGSEEFSNTILANTGVATCPGNYFGEGEGGYVRFCYANSDEKILDALDRIKKFLS
jgi:aspartate/methionine/tyrosine aminotransferase